MSMNIWITAERKISFKKKNGKTGSEMQSVTFAAQQTPTEVTDKILSSSNSLEAYIEFIKTRSSIEKNPVYAEDDYFCEQEPVAYEDYNWTLDHIKELKEWIENVEENGFTVKIGKI